MKFEHTIFDNPTQGRDNALKAHQDCVEASYTTLMTLGRVNTEQDYFFAGANGSTVKICIDVDEYSFVCSKETQALVVAAFSALVADQRRIRIQEELNGPVV